MFYNSFGKISSATSANQFSEGADKSDDDEERQISKLKR